MSNAHSRHYLTIWFWLMAMVILSVAAASALPKLQAMMLIFSVAIVKAFLVARHYMHLRHERAIIYAIALVPLVFVVIFLIGLFPDFVYHPTKP
jgi:caa(3)-type oxidase subunit IV